MDNRINEELLHMEELKKQTRRRNILAVQDFITLCRISPNPSIQNQCPGRQILLDKLTREYISKYNENP